MDTLLLPFVSTLHALAAVVWVGGMFFAHIILRPALMDEPPATRLGIWIRVLSRFFAWVWGAVAILPVTGYALVYLNFGGFAAAGRSVALMHILAWVMIALFAFMVFKPYAALKIAVAAGDSPTAAKHMNTMRRIVTTNLILGLTVVTAGVSARFWG